MALDWLKSGLLARRGYAKAIEQLQQQLKKRRNDPRLQLQLAEVMIQAKRTPEALKILDAVADEFALQGFAARAIAILKRIRGLDPTNASAEEKLAYLISQQDNPTPSPWAAKREERRPAFEIGMEEIEDGGMGMEEISDSAMGGEEVDADEEWEAPAEARPSSDVAAPAKGLPPAATDSNPFGLDLSDESVRHEFLALLDMAFTEAPPAGSGEGKGASTGVAGSPLFSDFRPDELIEVIRGLNLVTFEPGEILVTQGEPGESLFILASGRARAYLKDRGGRNVQVREMSDGDFFGEIAIMSGGPRTATITAETRCELLVLDRAGLDKIAKTHPRVREVLQEFYAKRVNMSVDAAAQRMGQASGG